MIKIDITVNFNDVRKIANEADLDVDYEAIEAVSETLLQEECYRVAAVAIERLIIRKLKARIS